MNTVVSFLKQKVVWRALLGIVLVIGGWYVFSSKGDSNRQTITVQSAPFSEQVSVSGTVVAARDVDLGFAQSGRVSGVYVAIGQRVAAGTLLAQTENDDLRATLAQKQAALQVQEAKLKSLKEGTRAEEIAVTESTVESDIVALAQARVAMKNAIQAAYTTSDDAVRNKVDQFFSSGTTQSPHISFFTPDQQAEINLESSRLKTEAILTNWARDIASISTTSNLQVQGAFAQSNLGAVASLLSFANVALNAALPASANRTTIAGYIADMSTARSSVNSALSTLTSAITAERAAASTLDRNQKTLLLQKAGPTGSDIDEQEAQVRSAAADVQSAQAQLDKTIIRAPFTGVITTMDVKVGEISSPTTSEISMISEGLFQIECYIPEVEIAALSVGDSATTTLDAFGTGASFGAKIVAIDPGETVVSGVSTYKTTLQFLKPDARIRKGMTASVVITAHEVPHAIVVPQGAVFLKGGRTTVQVLREDPVDVEVETGVASSVGNVQIVKGLSDGDVVILNPDTSL